MPRKPLRVADLPRDVQTKIVAQTMLEGARRAQLCGCTAVVWLTLHTGRPPPAEIAEFEHRQCLRTRPVSACVGLAPAL